MKLLRPNFSSFASKFLPADCRPDVESALGSAALLLEAAGVETARLDAECLLAYVLECPRWQLTIEPARRLRDSSDARIRVRDERGDVVVLTSAAAALRVCAEYDQSAA